MSPRAVLVAIVITLALGVVTYVGVLKPPAPSLASARPLLDGPVTAATAMTIAYADGGSLRFERGLGAESWTIAASRAGSTSPGPSWPAQASRVRAALRLLSEAKTLDQSPRAPAGELVTLTIESPDSSARLRLEEAALAGRAVAQAGEQPPVVVDASLARMLGRASVEEWTDKAALQTGIGTPARVTLRAGSSSLVLARGGGRWGIIEPFAAAADERIVPALLEDLAGVKFERFLGDAAPNSPDLGLASPGVTVEVESELRRFEGDDVRRLVLKQRLDIGQAADMAASGRYAQVTVTGEGAWGPAVGVVPGAGLAAIRAEPLAYVSRRRVSSPAADISTIELKAPRSGPARFERALEGWTVQGSTEAPAPAAPGQVKLLEELLALACGARAQDVLAAAPERTEHLIELTLWAGEGEPVASLRLGMTPDEKLVLADPRFAHVYKAQEHTPLIAALRDELPKLP